MASVGALDNDSVGYVQASRLNVTARGGFYTAIQQPLDRLFMGLDEHDGLDNTT
jgi:hypothetical protein